MNITVTIQADEKLLQALNGLAHSLKLFSTTGNALGEVIENNQTQQPTAAQATAAVPTTPTTQNTPAPVAQPAPATPTSSVPVAPTAPATPEQVSAAAAPTTQASAVPTSEQSYTLDQLAVAATQLVDAGRREELVQLLQQFGVQALTALPKEQYGAFATALRQMGAKI